MVRSIALADTSVLINFLRIDRMDLIEAHPASFIATDHVAAEIADAYPETSRPAMRSPSIPAKSPNNASMIQRN